MYTVAVLVSGSGSNFQSIARAIGDGRIKNCRIGCVIADRPGALALEKAETLGIPSFCLPRKEYKAGLSDAVLKTIGDCGGADLIVLAGFLSILRGEILEKFENRIINIHPSLIPAFCGDGMYGLRVHQAVLDYGAKITGCTVHLVDGGTDTGPIVLQKAVPVTTEDPVRLQQDVLVQEHEAIVEVVAYFAEGRVQIDGRKVRIV